MKNEEKLSQKKLFMMLTVEMFAMTGILYPSILIGFAGKNGLFLCVAAAGVLLFLVVPCLLGAAENISAKRETIERQKTPQNQESGNRREDSLNQESGNSREIIWLFAYRTGRLFAPCYAVRYFIHGLFLSVIFLNLIQEVLLPDSSKGWIALPVLILIYFSAGKPQAVRGRMIEAVFPYVFLPVLIVLGAALFQLDVKDLPKQLLGSLYEMGDGFFSSRLTDGYGDSFFSSCLTDGYGERTNPAAGISGIKKLCYALYGASLFYQPVEFAAFYGKNMPQNKRKRTVVAACFFVIFFNLLLYMVTVAMFGAVRTGEKLWSALYIMQSVRLPGRFVERLDILFLVFWIFGTFVLISEYIHMSLACLEQTFSKENGEKEKEENNEKENKDKMSFGKKITKVGCVGLLFLLALWIRESDKMFSIFVPYKMWIDVPFTVLSVCMISGCKRWKTEKRA